MIILNQIPKETQIENATMKVCGFMESRKNVGSNWESYSEKQLWVELISCILGSRVRYETAMECANHLDEVGLLEISKLLKNPSIIEKKIAHELNKPIYPPLSRSKGSRYRYPKSKSKCIVNTAISVYKERLTLQSILRKSNDGVQAREALIKKCYGIGPKQASLFLRNISFTEDLAIIDCHVMSYMKMLKIDENSENYNENKTSSYLQKENMLRLYALSKRKKLATLDIGIWTVMRLVKKRNETR